MGACTQKLSGGISLPYFSDEEVDCRISQPSGFCRCFFGIPMCLQLTSVLFMRGHDRNNVHETCLVIFSPP